MTSEKNKRLFELIKDKFIPSPKVEKSCCHIRKALLEQSLLNKLSSEKDYPYPIETACIIASHLFLTEYVYYETKKEREQINELEKVILDSLTQKQWDPLTIFQIAVIATYKELQNSTFAEHIPLPLAEAPLDFQELIQRQITEPTLEKALKKKIPLLKKIENTISQKFQKQYEENPYHKWISLPSFKKTPFSDHISQLFPYKKIETSSGPLDILIPGCGTGTQIIAIANTYENCRILALDISLNALAYAARKVKEYDLKNIEILQGDLLDIGSLEKSFDYIECIGVMHSLENPQKGLAVLAQQLKPKGLLYVTLYSQHARQGVIAAKDFIKQNHFAPTLEGMREARQRILSLEDGDIIKQVSHLPDFYTTGTCRELLFYVHEERMTLPQIAKIPELQELEFIGFPSLDRKTVEAYKASFPDDPLLNSWENWKQFEEKKPGIFGPMYHLCFQKI
ncbi:MAG: SAM-dependent methyltransferase [Chlamydiales bacterium]|jgi:SAM-dependent methyltransferase